MNKTIWYGVTNNDVRFADNQAALTSAGIDNAKSFSVTGDVTGLNLIGGTDTQQQSSGSQAQPQG